MDTDYEDLPSFRAPPTARVNKTYGKASARRLQSLPRPPPLAARQGLNASQDQENLGTHSRSHKRNISDLDSEPEEATRSEPKRKVPAVGRKRGKIAEGGLKVKRRKVVGGETKSDGENGDVEVSDADEATFNAAKRFRVSSHPASDRNIISPPPEKASNKSASARKPKKGEVSERSQPAKLSSRPFDMEVDTEGIDTTRSLESAVSGEKKAIRVTKHVLGVKNNLEEAPGKHSNEFPSSKPPHLKLQITANEEIEDLPEAHLRELAAPKIPLVDKSNLPKKNQVRNNDVPILPSPHRSRTLPNSERVLHHVPVSQLQSFPSGIPNVGRPRTSLLSAPSSPRALRVFRDPSASAITASPSTKDVKRSQSARTHGDRENSPALDLKGLRAALPTSTIASQSRATSILPSGNSLGLQTTHPPSQMVIPRPTRVSTPMILSPRMIPAPAIAQLEHGTQDFNDDPQLLNLRAGNEILPEPREGSVIPEIQDEINSSMILETFEFDEGDADQTITIEEATRKMVDDRDNDPLNEALVARNAVLTDEELTESPYFSQQKPTSAFTNSAKVDSQSHSPQVMFDSEPRDFPRRSHSPDDDDLHSPVSSTESMENFSFSLPPRVPSPPVDPVDPSGQVPRHEDELAYYIRTTSSFQNQPPLFGLDSRNSTIDSLNDDEIGMGHVPGSRVGGTDRQMERVRRRRLMDQILAEAIQVGEDVSEDEMNIY